MPDAVTHPTPQELAAFGLGKLPEATTLAVAVHLETCADCLKIVEKLQPDSFVNKVHAARPGRPSLPPGTPPSRFFGTDSMLPNASASPAGPQNVPPELANHPKYRIERELGRGGMGVVYLAVHTSMERQVAIKVINPGVLTHRDALPRFQAEVRAAAKLDHPNIVRAYDAEQAGPLHLLVMEYVEGRSLSALLKKKGPLSVAAACNLARQTALGLQHAFEQGMVHRDIKPQNLMLTDKRQVKILDFGLARLRGAAAQGPGLTETGSFMGTPDYVSPEQAKDARSADVRSDLYSLGCTLYCLLTGHPPFPDEGTPMLLMLAHIHKEPPPVHLLRLDVPPELSAVVARLLAKEPAQRHQTPVELAQALVPFIKRGAKSGTAGSPALPPATASAGKATMLPGDTSRLPGAGMQVNAHVPIPEVRDWAEQPPAVRTGQKCQDSPAFAFANLDAAPASVRPGPGTKGRSLRWHRRKAVRAGAGMTALLVLAAVIIVRISIKTPTSEAVGALEINTSEAPKTSPPVSQGGAAPKSERAGNEKSRETGTRDLPTDSGVDGIASRPPARDPQEPIVLEGHTRQIWGLAFDPEGKRLLSGGEDGTVKLWDMKKAVWVRDLAREGYRFVSVAWSPDGKFLAASGDHNLIKVWDGATGELLHELGGHQAAVRSLAFSGDSRWLASGSYDQSVKLWNLATAKESLTFQGHASFVFGVAFSPDNRLMASAGCRDRTVKVWDARTGEERHTFTGHEGDAMCVAYGPDGKRVASGGQDGTVRLWDLTRGVEERVLRGSTHLGRVFRVAFSPDGRLLACAADHGLVLWDVATGRELKALTGPHSFVFGLAFSRDGRQLAGGCADRTIKVWNVKDVAASF